MKRYIGDVENLLLKERENLVRAYQEALEEMFQMHVREIEAASESTTYSRVTTDAFEAARAALAAFDAAHPDIAAKAKAMRTAVDIET